MAEYETVPVTRGRKVVIIVSHVVAVTFAVAVAAVNGKVSWHHGVSVAESVGESQAFLFPLAYDGMMLSGAALAYVDVLRGLVPRPWSVVGLWLGTALTLLFNVLSAWDRGWSAMAIAAVYAVTFLITVEALFHPSQRLLSEKLDKRRARREAATASAVAPTVTAPMPPAPAPVSLAPVFTAEVIESVTEPTVAPAVRAPRRRKSGGAYPGATDAAVDALLASPRADMVMVES